jgi:hypothetical protein
MSRRFAILITLPSLATLFDEQDDDDQGRKAIDPPLARHEKLDQQSDNNDAGQVAACDRLDCIGAECSAADLIGNANLCSRKPQHDRDREDGKD